MGVPSGLTLEELRELLRITAKNWLTVDGLWFTGVEDRFGLAAAVELDVRMWRRQAVAEAHRLKRFLRGRRGLEAVLRIVELMSWALSGLFDWEVERRPGAVVFTVRRCWPQEERVRQGRPVFPCRETGVAMWEGIAEVVAPEVRARCLFCPPGDRPPEAWCSWELKEG